MTTSTAESAPKSPRKPAARKPIKIKPMPEKQTEIVVLAPQDWMDPRTGYTVPIQGHRTNVLVAAVLARTYLQKLKVATLEEMESKLAQRDPATVNLLRALHVPDWHFPLIAGFRAELDRVTVKPPVKLAVCDTCGRQILCSGSKAPANCTMRRGCTGSNIEMPAKKDVITIRGVRQQPVAGKADAQ